LISQVEGFQSQARSLLAPGGRTRFGNLPWQPWLDTAERERLQLLLDEIEVELQQEGNLVELARRSIATAEGLRSLLGVKIPEMPPTEEYVQAIQAESDENPMAAMAATWKNSTLGGYETSPNTYVFAAISLSMKVRPELAIEAISELWPDNAHNIYDIYVLRGTQELALAAMTLGPVTGVIPRKPSMKTRLKYLAWMASWRFARAFRRGSPIFSEDENSQRLAFALKQPLRVDRGEIYKLIRRVAG